MDYKIKITIAEDHTLMRRSLIALLNEDPNLQIIGEAGNGKELLELLNTQQPDIIILDLEMPVMSGWEVLKVLHQDFSHIKIIILSMYADLALLDHYAENGVHSYITKGCNPEILFQAIHTVFNKGYYVDDSIPKHLFKNIIAQQVSDVDEELTLNQKEKEILMQICNGKTNKEIAGLFKISPSTVDFHRSKIYGKTKSSNVADLFKYAIKKGIINIL